MDHAHEITARTLRDILAATHRLLDTYRSAINAMNVYPVPDGDTGTNLFLTVSSVLDEISSHEGAMDAIGECTVAASRGALMGARGNSGVIFSQIIRGFAEALASTNEDGGTLLEGVCRGLVLGSELAERAVLRPVEGTILTIARRTAREAERVVASNPSVAAAMLYEAAHSSLMETPSLLSVLKEANVVDAGGAGYVLFVEAVAGCLDLEFEVVGRKYLDLAVSRIGGRQHLSEKSEGGPQDLRYEVMYLLEAHETAMNAFREVWAGVGDSIVVVGQDGVWNCHIHTDDIGAAIEAGIEAGKPKNIRVTDLSEQISEERWVVDAHGQGAPDPFGAPDDGISTAVVAVANGEGIGRIFRSMGVNRIVQGGQSMNPSTADLLDAVDSLVADQVIILPNNSNIIPVAQMAAELSSKEVRILPTREAMQGLAALMEFDPLAGLEENVSSMGANIERVGTGEVTQAVRDSVWSGGVISAGDYLGLKGGEIVAVEAGLVDASKVLLKHLIRPGSEIATLIEGDGSSHLFTRQLSDWLGEEYPGLEVETHHGGQPLYPYLFGVE